MAGDWIKMRGNLWDDPRVGGLCDATNQPEAMIVGALYWLWATADQHTEDGFLPGMTLRAIDRKTGVQGFAQALCDIEWLAVEGSGVRIVGFEQHNGASAKKRCQTAQRVAKHRTANASETPEDQSANADSVTDALAREEKRREEKKEISEANASSSAGPTAEPSEPPAKPKTAQESPEGDEATQPLLGQGSLIADASHGLAEALAATVAAAERPKAPALPNCPADELIAVYHETLPELPRVRLKTPDRVRLLSKAWRWVLTSKRPDNTRRAETPAEAVEWFRGYFAQVRDNDFLMGRVERSGAHRNWSPDIDYLLSDRGMKLVIEKTYANEVPA